MSNNSELIRALGRFRLHSRDGVNFENGWSLRELLVYLGGDATGKQTALKATKPVVDETPFGICPVLFNYAQRLSYHISNSELQNLIPHVPGLLGSYSVEKEGERASFLLKSTLYLVFASKLIKDGGAKYVEPLLQAIEEGTEQTARYLKCLSRYCNMYHALRTCDTLKAAAYELHLGESAPLVGEIHVDDELIFAPTQAFHQPSRYSKSADLLGSAIIELTKNDPAALSLGFSLLGNAIILGPNGHAKESNYVAKASRIGDMSTKMAWAYPERQTA